MEYRTHFTHATVASRTLKSNIGQIADALWTNSLALQRKQTKTKTDSVWKRANWQLQLTTPQTETQNLSLLLSCVPLTPGP